MYWFKSEGRLANTDTQTHTHRQTDTHRQTHTHTDTDRQTHTHTQTHTQTHTHADTRRHRGHSTGAPSPLFFSLPASSSPFGLACLFWTHHHRCCCPIFRWQNGIGLFKDGAAEILPRKTLRIGVFTREVCWFAFWCLCLFLFLAFSPPFLHPAAPLHPPHTSHTSTASTAVMAHENVRNGEGES